MEDSTKVMTRTGKEAMNALRDAYSFATELFPPGSRPRGSGKWGKLIVRAEGAKVARSGDMTKLDYELLNALRDVHAFATELFPESAQPSDAADWEAVLQRGIRRAQRERVKREPPKMYVDRHCKHCGHSATIESAEASLFGSEADFCTKCDRPWRGGKPYFKGVPAAGRVRSRGNKSGRQAAPRLSR